MKRYALHVQEVEYLSQKKINVNALQERYGMGTVVQKNQSVKMEDNGIYSSLCVNAL